MPPAFDVGKIDDDAFSRVNNARQAKTHRFNFRMFLFQAIDFGYDGADQRVDVTILNRWNYIPFFQDHSLLDDTGFNTRAAEVYADRCGCAHDDEKFLRAIIRNP